MQKRLIVLVFMFLLNLSQSSFAEFFDPNPQGNFKESDYLMSVNRPIAADKLINDVIVFCTKKNDEPCLAESYYYFGKLLLWRGADTDKWSKFRSYVEQDITTDNIHQKSMDYFEKALGLARKYNLYDMVSGIYIKVGILQSLYFKDRTVACESFDQSLDYHSMYIKANPNANITLEKGFKSFEEYISQAKKEAGCLK